MPKSSPWFNGFRRAVWVALAAALAPALALASVERLDPRLDVSRLAAEGGIRVTTSRDGERYRVDAVAVLRGSADLFFEAAANLPGYAGLGFTNVRDCRWVRDQGDLKVAYMHMAMGGVTSKHFLELRLHRRFGASGEFAMEFSRVNGPVVPGTVNEPAFAFLEGSLHLKDLGNGTYALRYVTEADVATSVPAFLISVFVRASLANDMKSSLRLLEKASRDAAVR